MLSVLMAFETLPMTHLFIGEIQIKIKSWKPKSKLSFIFLAEHEADGGPNVGVHMHCGACVWDRLTIYKTALQTALHTVSRLCPRVKLPFHNFHYIWSSEGGGGVLLWCAARWSKLFFFCCFWWFALWWTVSALILKNPSSTTPGPAFPFVRRVETMNGRYYRVESLLGDTWALHDVHKEPNK